MALLSLLNFFKTIKKPNLFGLIWFSFNMKKQIDDLILN